MRKVSIFWFPEHFLVTLGGSVFWRRPGYLVTSLTGRLPTMIMRMVTLLTHQRWSQTLWLSPETDRVTMMSEPEMLSSCFLLNKAQTHHILVGGCHCACAGDAGEGAPGGESKEIEEVTISEQIRLYVIECTLESWCLMLSGPSL